jgi:hypothetical protein
MDWVGTALLMGLAAALSASATLALLRRREIAARFARKRAPGAVPPGKPPAAAPRPARPAAPAKPAPAPPRRTENTGFRLSPAPAAAPPREAEQWERRFKLMHAMVPEARRQEIIRRAMAKHGLDRARAIRKIVEDRQGEDAMRS